MDHQTPHFRTCFYIGGHYQNVPSRSDTLNSVMIEQMYVEQLRPLNPQKVLPIVLWHGMAQTGMGWITTPDGRPGWACYFLSQGYTVYVVDSPERGRSPWLPGSGKLINVHAQYVQDFWTATKDNGVLWPQASLHTQWPGTGKLGDPYFDSFMASQIQSRSDYARTEELAGKLGAELFKRIGPACLFTHSQGGSHGWKIADLVPDLVKAIVALEPVGPPFVNRIASALKNVDSGEIVRPYGITITPINYDPPLLADEKIVTITLPSKTPVLCDTILQETPQRRLKNISTIPTLIVTSESGYHANYDHATVAYMRQAGVDVTWLNLPEVDIKGNGHFMFSERNNTEVAEEIHKWLEKF